MQLVLHRTFRIACPGLRRVLRNKWIKSGTIVSWGAVARLNADWHGRRREERATTRSDQVDLPASAVSIPYLKETNQFIFLKRKIITSQLKTRYRQFLRNYVGIGSEVPYLIKVLNVMIVNMSALDAWSVFTAYDWLGPLPSYIYRWRSAFSILPTISISYEPRFGEAEIDHRDNLHNIDCSCNSCCMINYRVMIQFVHERMKNMAYVCVFCRNGKYGNKRMHKAIEKYHAENKCKAFVIPFRNLPHL